MKGMRAPVDRTDGWAVQHKLAVMDANLAFYVRCLGDEGFKEGNINECAGWH